MRLNINIDKENLDKNIEEILMNKEMNKSEKFRNCFDLGLSVKEIFKIINNEKYKMKVRYNFVYNVISNYCLMEDLDIIKKERGGKKKKILKCYKEGMSKKEIVRAVKVNYNYVYKVIREEKENNKGVSK